MAIEVGREKLRQAILAALADQDIVKIIDCATIRPKSVNDVIRETDIPHSTAYRKIKGMLEEGLLVTEKIEITSDGKKFSLVRSTLKSINIKYERGKTMVQVEYNVNVLEQTAEHLFSINAD